MEAVLTVKNAGRYFGAVEALKEISLEVRAGEVTALLGPNGAGKTTLLRMVLGLIVPSSGEVRVLGKSAREAAQAGGGRVGSVGEGYEPIGVSTLGLLETLQSDVSPGFDREAFRAWCGQKELGPKKRFGELSKGQKRWVLCGLALAMKPDLLLLDEPADGLDPAARRGLYEGLRNHATRHDTAVLVTTHLLGDIERVADQVVIIDRGRVKLSAALEELREEVREVECAAGEFAGNERDVMVLAREVTGNSQRVWLRSRGGGWDRGRTVGLEDLYLALTGATARNADAEDLAVITTEKEVRR